MDGGNLRGAIDTLDVAHASHLVEVKYSLVEALSLLARLDLLKDVVDTNALQEKLLSQGT